MRRGRLQVEAVTQAVHGADGLDFGGDSGDLAAQVLDVAVDGAVGHVQAVVPGQG